MSFSHQVKVSMMDPPAEASSANHTSVASLAHFFIKGATARAYMAMARGSPWVVPSSEISVRVLVGFCMC